MKKSILNIALLSMLFIMGACSTEPTPDPDKEIPEVVDPVVTEFLNSVKEKSSFQYENKIGTFGTDGNTFVVDMAFLTLGVSGTLTFESASSGTEAIYKDTSDKVVTITLNGDVGGTITVGGTVTTFTYASVVDLNKIAFLNSVKTKDTFQYENKIGLFGTDGKTFVVDVAFLTLGVSGTLTFESASSGTEAIYKDTSDKVVTITLNGDVGGTITVGGTVTTFTYASVVDLNKIAFLNSVKTKDTFQYENKIGLFGTDGKTFVVDVAFLTLGVSGTLTFESASSGTEAIYKDTSDKVVTITLNGDVGGTITVGGTVTTFTYVLTAWQTVGTAGFSVNDAMYTSLALDKDGVPYVAYKDRQTTGKASVMKFVNGAWTAVGSASFSAGTASCTSLVLDKDGVPYVAYTEGKHISSVHGKTVTVMKFVNDTWTVVGIEGFSAGEVAYTSLALDKDGVPYVAYGDKGNDGKATVMKYDIVK